MQQRYHSAMEWIIILIVAVIVVGFVALYNRLVRLRNRTDNSWAQVDVQLKRRYDLIPNLVETVGGYAAHESETFEAVVAARSAAQAAHGVDEQGAAENMLSGALRKLFALAESYPELRARQHAHVQQRGADRADQHRGCDRPLLRSSLFRD